MNDRIEIDKRFTELVTFLRKQIGEYNMPIKRDTLIEDHLGVTGDEAENLIKAFGKKYNISIDNFNLSKYFYGEPGIFDLQNRVIEPFTIAHLEKAIVAGRLDEEVINS